MGKGDKRTKRGKINTGSYGNSRKRMETTAVKKTAKASSKPAAPKKKK